MRRTAALVALVALCRAGQVRAESTPQLLLQAGGVGQVSGELTRPVYAIDWIHSPFHFGAGWFEFGILQRDFQDIRYVYPYGSDSAGGSGQLATDNVLGVYSPQILELSTGVIVGPTGHAFFPYLRAGFGIYHEEIISGDLPTPPAPAARVTPQAVHYPSGQEDWGLGVSVGVGARLAIPHLPAPSVEARLHFTRLDGQVENQLFTLTGGVWFR